MYDTNMLDLPKGRDTGRVYGGSENFRIVGVFPVRGSFDSVREAAQRLFWRSGWKPYTVSRIQLASFK
jgi:hypothetical protein